MAIMTGGQAVVAALQAEGVRTVFGIPGMHTLHLYEALRTAPTDPPLHDAARTGRGVHGRWLRPGHR